jgi:hypothetical protein
MFMICLSDKTVAPTFRGPEKPPEGRIVPGNERFFAADMGSGFAAKVYQAIKATFRRVPMRSRH